MIAKQDRTVSDRKQVIHVWDGYGKRSQTWLYRLLSNMRRWTPSILTKATADLEQAKHEQPWPERRLFFWPEASPVFLAVDRLRSAFRTNLLHRQDNRRSVCVNSLVEAHQFRVLHIHSGPSLFWDSLQAVTVPKVVSFYGSDIFRRHRKKYMRRLRRLVHQPYAFVVTSDALSEKLEGLGTPQNRIHVIPVGIDLRDFPDQGRTSELRRQRSNRDMRILTVGRLTDFKAPHMLPQVARMLLDGGLDFKWTLVGEGTLEGLVSKNISAWGVRGCFELVGSLPFDEVCKLMGEADLMVHNAVVAPDGGREALGVVLVEAAAMGLPVVSCRVGGIPEVIVDGKTGFLVEPGDLEELATQAMALARNRELRIRMGMKAMERARTVFDSARLSSRMEELYDAVVASHRDPNPIAAGKS